MCLTKLCGNTLTPPLSVVPPAPRRVFSVSLLLAKLSLAQHFLGASICGVDVRGVPGDRRKKEKTFRNPSWLLCGGILLYTILFWLTRTTYIKTTNPTTHPPLLFI